LCVKLFRVGLEFAMIEVPEELIEYFGISNTPTLFLLPRAMRDEPRLGKMISALLVQVDQVLQSENPDQPAWVSQSRHLPFEHRRISATAHIIGEAIAARRLSILTSDINPDTIRPYNHSDLSGIRPDVHGLVKLSHFDFGHSFFPGLRRRNCVFEILPSIPDAVNSMHWTLQELVELAVKSDILIRLDPLMVHPVDGYAPIIQKMLVYGKPLDWRAIANLKEENHMRWRPAPGWQEDIEFTDLVWSPGKDGVHFTCEEVPKLATYTVRGSRYFHGIYVPGKHSFIHCDAAIRVYSGQELVDRHQAHVRQIGKIGKRIKVFLVGSEITAEEWISIVCTFYVWNNDIDNYFGVGIKG
jgi:hypothetical protein